jgi:hypothetical protein
MEPKLNEPMLTPIEDLGLSHDAEQDDDEWDGLENVYAKFTAQWYVDPKGLAWNFENPGYVLREREVFLDGVCSVSRDVRLKLGRTQLEDLCQETRPSACLHG